MYYPEFNKLLTMYLAKEDRSATWLAHRLDFSSSTVSRWLNDGTRPANPETIIKIADILRINEHDRKKLLAASGYAYIEEKTPTPNEALSLAQILSTNSPSIKETTPDQAKQTLKLLTRSFGKELFTVLDSHSMSQRNLARLLGFSPAAVSQWRNGTRIPDAVTLQKIGKELNLTKSEKSALLHTWLTSNYATSLLSVLTALGDNAHVNDIQNLVDILEHEKAHRLA